MWLSISNWKLKIILPSKKWQLSFVFEFWLPKCPFCHPSVTLIQDKWISSLRIFRSLEHVWESVLHLHSTLLELATLPVDFKESTSNRKKFSFESSLFLSFFHLFVLQLSGQKWNCWPFFLYFFCFIFFIFLEINLIKSFLIVHVLFFPFYAQNAHSCLLSSH